MGRRPGPLLALILCAACSGPRRTPPPVGKAPDAFASPYLPADHQGQMLTDYAALRDCGLLDFLERMPMFEGMHEVVARPFGCEPDQLDRVRTAIVFLPSDSRSAVFQMTSVAEVAPEVRPRPPDKSATAVEINGHPGFRGNVSNPQQSASFWPAPGLAVSGEYQVLTSLPAGNAGAPHPDLQPLLPGERLLFQYAFGRFGQPITKLTGTIGWWFPVDDSDPVDFVRIRLCRDADGGIVASLRFRFAKGTTGLRATEDWVREGLVQQAGNPKLAAIKPLLTGVVVATEERDLDMSLALGTPRQAIGKIERAVMAFMSNR